VSAMAPSTAAPRFQWSELARRSSEVGEALDTFGEVTVQRGSQTLRLGPPQPAEVTQVFHDLCRLLGSLTTAGQPDLVTTVLERAWPWTRVLPHDDQLALAAEVGSMAETAESLGTFTPLLEVLADWRRTARAWADGEGRPILVDEPAGTAVARPSA